jgi:hypothetical protein
MYKKTLGAVALTSGLAFGLAPAASAADVPCGTPAVDAVYKTVVTPATDAVFKQVKVVDVKASPAVPAVTEQVKVIDVEAKPATPGSPAVEEVSHFETRVVTPEQTIHHEAETHVVHHDAVTHEETVVDSPAIWANWAPNDTKGPQDYIPVWPSDDRGKWIVHDQGIPPGHEGPDGVYQKGEGNSPFFYRQHEVSHVEVITDHEAYDETVVDKEAYDEVIPAVTEQVKVIDVEAKPAVPATPAVEEVSHFETRIVTPAVPAVEEVFHFEEVLSIPAKDATKTSVLVSEAVPAGDDCEVPVSARRTPQTLAFTGSETGQATLLGGFLLTLAGLAYALRRRVTGS